MAGDHDDFGSLLGAELADFGEDLHAVAIGKPDVEQDDFVVHIAEQSEAFGGGGNGDGGVALFAEDVFQSAADGGLVVNDEDVVHTAEALGSGTGRLGTAGFEAGEPWARAPLEPLVAGVEPLVGAGVSASGTSITKRAPAG
jgi:hypothetical protein